MEVGQNPIFPPPPPSGLPLSAVQDAPVVKDSAVPWECCGMHLNLHFMSP